ncbi:tetratricopeptide repeat protein [Pinibacter soli]|uniref:Tetratricopeptide repeat protein n=1 Tax=Pinibacter soli TaxID=3044211 RepID=A0ABT6RB65_9BACT|nr:tetratricopeptide repeat protein [Pinibacter soli]MDI3319765.1 tetratricopeptide repeat protein [Pinibacter soli]
MLIMFSVSHGFAQLEYDGELNKAYIHESGRPDTMFLFLRNSYNQAMEKKDRTAAAIALQKMGQICYHLGHYSQSLDLHLQAAEFFKNEDDKKLYASNLNDIGTLYYYNKQMDDARKQFDLALEMLKKYPSDPGLAITNGNIGHLYEKRQMYDSAFYFQRLALNHYTNAMDKTGIAGIYENMGSIFEDLEQYDSSGYYYSKALEIYQKVNDQVSSIEIFNNLGDILRKTGRYQASLVQTRKAIEYALHLQEGYQLSAAYRDMAKAWHLLGRDDSAYIYHELSRKSLLDIYSKENNKQVAFLQVLNEVGKKNAEIEKLRIEHRNTVILTICAVVVVVLLVLLSILIISRQRLKIKNEILLRHQHQEVFKTRSELMEVDLQNKQLQEDVLRQSLEMKAKELTAHTLHIIQKNQLLEELHDSLEKMVKDDKRDQKKQLQQLIQRIDMNFNQDQHWDEFRNIFEQVHESFFERVRRICHDLTANDLRLLALLKMNIDSSDIATLLGISSDSLRVTRYRLRKKLNLEKGENLSAYIQGL